MQLLANGLHDAVRSPFQFRAVRAPRFCNAEQHGLETRHPSPILRREVRAAKKRFAVGGKENGQRPASTPLHELNGRDVDVIDIGPFLSIDFDADEVLVQDASDRFVLEAFFFHHVTPVT